MSHNAQAGLRYYRQITSTKFHHRDMNGTTEIGQETGKMRNSLRGDSVGWDGPDVVDHRCQRSDGSREANTGCDDEHPVIKARNPNVTEIGKAFQDLLQGAELS